MSVAFDVTKPLPGASFGATVRLTRPLSQGVPEGLPAVLADANGLMLIPGLQEIAEKPELLVTSAAPSDRRSRIIATRSRSAARCTRRCRRSSWCRTSRR